MPTSGGGTGTPVTTTNTVADFGIGIGFVTGATIMTDARFQAHGGDVANLVALSSSAQRGVAYAIAEQQTMRHFRTWLEETIVTGTFAWPIGHARMQLPLKRITQVMGVTAIHEAGCDCLDDAYEISGCAWLIDGMNGVIDLRSCGSQVGSGGARCNCAWAQGHRSNAAKLARIVVKAGFPAGHLATVPQFLAGLASASKLALQQLIDPSGAEGGPGNPALTSFSDAGYSESRAGPFSMTAFGNSPEAQHIAKVLLGTPFRKKTVMGLRY
jgi:hypothetical protein